MPRRWWLGCLMSAGILISYIDRVNISHALLPMAADLHLSPVEQGIVLSAFSWGYVALMAVGGLIVDRIGPLRASASAASAWSVATALTGAAWSFPTLLASRVAVGAGEAPIFPANARLVREEFPLDERGRATALFDAGSYIGTALSAPVVVFLMVWFGWRVSFLVCSLLGFVWVTVWRHVAPRLCESDIRHFRFEGRAHIPPRDVSRLMQSRKVIGASYGFFAYNYAKSFFLTWFPAYLVSERGFSFLEVGIVGMLPPTCAVFGEFAAGASTDKLIQGGWSVTVARKLPLCTGMLLASSIALTEMVSSEWAVLTLLSFAFAATIAASPGIWAIPGDIAPAKEYVGTIGGIQNTFSNLAGIVAPVVTGLLVGWTGSFTPALVVSGIIAVSGAASYWFVVGELSPIDIAEEGG